MQNASFAEFLLMRLDRGAKKPMNRQIYLAIRDGILGQMLPAGMQLPSTRELSLELGAARNTIKFAYEQLMAEGYLKTLWGAGTFIVDTTPDVLLEESERERPDRTLGVHAELSRRGAQLIARAGASDLQWGAFMPGVPDITLFPIKQWNRLQNKHWRRSSVELLTYGQAGGYMPLRESIADHLRIARSVNCTPEQVIITAGTHQSLDIIGRLLGEFGDSAWIEDPCYWGTRSVLESTGIKTTAIPVDSEGIRFEAEDLHEPPRFICITPSHQYPLGMVLSLSRRRHLLSYASTKKVWIVEDDYDSEFRYGSRPLASLQGMDQNGRVIYMGTFSKTMFPGLRIGFLVVPQGLESIVSTAVSELYRGGQVFLQAVLADFISEGYFASHIRRMRLVYAKRLRLLQKTIAIEFGNAITSTGDEAGLHLTLKLPQTCDDHAISRAAHAAGILARPLSGYYAAPASAPRGLLLGYACVPDEHIPRAFATLASVIRMHCPELRSLTTSLTPTRAPTLP